MYEASEQKAAGFFFAGPTESDAHHNEEGHNQNERSAEAQTGAE
jgi:hypothetical protein